MEFATITGTISLGLIILGAIFIRHCWLNQDKCEEDYCT